MYFRRTYIYVCVLAPGFQRDCFFAPLIANLYRRMSSRPLGFAPRLTVVLSSRGELRPRKDHRRVEIYGE